LSLYRAEANGVGCTVQFFTDFADEAVVLSLLVTVATALVLLRWWRGALGWLVAGAGTLGAVLVLKLLFMACDGVFIHTPSGHTAAAALVVGGLATFGGAGARARAARALLFAISAAALIGVSRLALGRHTLAEVALGGIVGTLGALVLPWLAGPVPERLRIRGLALALLAVMVLLHGSHLRAEAELSRVASLLRGWPLAICRP
jgi:membrane-associated phospholipid phosphatase